MKRAHSIQLALAIFACLMSGCSREPETVALTNSVTTVSAGYPLASGLKQHMAGDANLTRAIVELTRGDQDSFQVHRMYFDFISASGQGRLFTITVDNENRRVYGSMDSAEVENPGPLKVAIWETVATDRIKDVAEVLAIARTNGLDDFCALYPGEFGAVALRLKQSDHRAMWQVLGMGAHPAGHTLALEIHLDAQTGTVLSRELQRPADAK